MIQKLEAIVEYLGKMAMAKSRALMVKNGEMLQQNRRQKLLGVGPQSGSGEWRRGIGKEEEIFLICGE